MTLYHVEHNQGVIIMFAKRSTIFKLVPYSCKFTWRTHVSLDGRIHKNYYYYY